MDEVPVADSAPGPVPGAFVQALRALGLTRESALMGWPLTGGVSSDIWCIRTQDGLVCAKRALAKLRVAADWHAPIERNQYEARWMEQAWQAQPGCTPRLLGQQPESGVLVMQWLAPQDHALWKMQLRDGQVNLDTARQVGQMLVGIHRFSAARPALAEAFATDDIFFDIRLEPYLVATAKRHPELSRALHQLVEVTRTTRYALVHGDVSPKNILIGPQGPVLLDAECAWWGDPAFDLAFCLNHLLLKCLWNPPVRDAFLAAFDAMSQAYLAGVDWEARQSIEARAAALLPGLLLARVDGKSPVEYVTDGAHQALVRGVAAALLLHPVEQLSDVRDSWREALLTVQPS
jgi:aminoglycoside phosphotransferase (APT) family kinase protein